MVDDGGLEHTVYEERLRELELFDLYQVGVAEDTIAVFGDLAEGCREEGGRLFSQVHSDRMRMRSDRDKLQHRKF